MRVLASLFAAVVILAAAGGGLTVWGLWHFGQGLPEYAQLHDYRPPTATRVHAGDGRLVTEFATQRRVFVPIEAIPKRVVRAFISAEDKNFYEHSGVDWFAVARAAVFNVQNIADDRRPVGASTITQQVTRMFLLTNEVSYVRKIKEAILAHRIERAMSKDRILELYLNEIFLGNRAYGVAAAALNYFDKPLDQLTVAEAAFLASLPKAPDRYYRERHRDAAIARRNYVLGRMVEDGYITPAEAEEAGAQPLQFRDPRGTEFVSADYFMEEVRRQLAGRFGEQELYGGGLSVRTTLDPKLQDVATRALREGLMAYDRRDGWRGPVAQLPSLDDWKGQLEKAAVPAGGEAWQLAVVIQTTEKEALIGLKGGERGRIPLAELKWARSFKPGTGSGPAVQKPADALSPRDVVMVEKLEGKDAPADGYALRQIPDVQGALVAMDPHTGRVLAMSGGFSARISVFNRATQAQRQPGSAFKPFVYLAALDKGFTPSTLVLDAPFSLDQGGGQGKWKPANYTEQFYGPTPLRVGIEKSRNVMTVRLAQNIGMEPIVEVARRFGITENLPPHLSMALGAGETTVLRLTAAYAMLVNGGKRIDPTFVDRVQDNAGRTIYKHDQRPCDGCTDLVWPGTESAAAALPAAPDGAAAAPADPGKVPYVPDTREQVADPRTVYQVVSMMEGVVQRGTGVRLREIGKPLAGKTGTTNDSMDAWFVGFSPDLAVGVFVGFDQPRSLGDKESGSSVAVPIFKDFMEAALKDKPATPFRVPPGLRLVRVDPETGRPAQPGDRGAIWEAFVPGTEPRGDEGVLDGGDAGSAWLPAAQASRPDQPPPVNLGTGTGGVY
ncbi:MAG TPA: penicillin-binding protein 1A [Azospirillaceae bacterium]|nr:penicillin-binding protein 1A [Azospirillaceae bacterium]